MGIKTALLTGDSRSTAMRAQEQLGQALDEVHAELLPKDKARIVTNYKKDGRTAMVGDGVNDAPALATADVGISMGVSGSALATETGHVILMSNDIRKIPKAIKLARRTRRKVIENIFISITTKAGVLAVALAGHPLVWLAVLVDVATCLIVILNSMLLLRGSGHSHTHGSSWCCGIFSPCHSHKTKHHHAKSCATPCQASANKKSCGPARCSSQSHSVATPQTTHLKSCASTKCSSLSSSTPCQSNSPEPCASHDYASEGNTCSSEDHCLDLLESQVSPCVKGEQLEEGAMCCGSKIHCEAAKHDSAELQEIEHCDKKSSCCEGNGQTTPRQCSSVVSDNDNGAKHGHCSESHEIDHVAHTHAHHHHHVLTTHKTCHANAVSKHACSSLRKREVGACCKSFRRECCGSQGHIGPAYGGLTEIVTE